MQENGMFTGKRKAAITKNKKDQYCKYCDHEQVASISHILLSCSVTKKRQIARHDYVCLEIYRRIIKDYCNIDTDIPTSYPIKCYIKGNLTVTYNKEIFGRKDGIYAKRPDIYIEDRDANIAYIIDVAIVKNDRLQNAYRNKLDKYSILQEKIRNDKQIQFVRIIPVIITIWGFIHKQSVKQINDLGITVDFVSIIRTLIIRQMKDIMFYISNGGSSMNENIELNSPTEDSNNELESLENSSNQ